MKSPHNKHEQYLMSQHFKIAVLNSGNKYFYIAQSTTNADLQSTQNLMIRLLTEQLSFHKTIR
jgi:hypothetical protein